MKQRTEEGGGESTSYPLPRKSRNIEIEVDAAAAAPHPLDRDRSSSKGRFLRRSTTSVNSKKASFENDAPCAEDASPGKRRSVETGQRRSLREK